MAFAGLALPFEMAMVVAYIDFDVPFELVLALVTVLSDVETPGA